MSAYFIERLEHLKKEFPALIREIRGKGLLLGMELKIEGEPVVKACLEKGMLINCAAGNTLRFVPALIVQRRDIDQLVDVLRGIFLKLPIM